MATVNYSQTLASVDAPASSALPFSLVVVYVALEFGRPQALLPALEPLRLPGLVTALLALCVCFSSRVRVSDRQTKLFLLLLGVMAIHVPLAVNNYWAFHAFTVSFVTFLAYLGVITFVNSLQRFNTLLSVWLAIHVYLAIVGVANQGRGVPGYFGDENDLSLVLNMVIALPLFLAVAATRVATRILYIVLTALILAADILTQSRGGFIGLVAVGVYCWVRAPRKLAVGTLALLFVLFAAYAAPATYWEEIRSIQHGANDDTGKDRLYQWRIGWSMFLDNPVIGVGQGNFAWEFRRYEVMNGFDTGLEGRSRAGRVAHSLYFTVIPELGLIGAVLVLLLVCHTYRDARLTRRLARAAIPRTRQDGLGRMQPLEAERVIYLTLFLEAALVGYLVTGMFISVLYYPNFWILMGFVVALRRIVTTAQWRTCSI